MCWLFTKYHRLLQEKIQNKMIKIDFMTQSGQFYLIPTIRVTYDKFLYGFYNIEFWWLKWGFEIILKP